VYFQFLELRHKIEIYNLTGRVAECPLDEMNRPRASVDPQLRVPPAEEEIGQLFAGWRGELATCRKFAPAARNYAAARLAADVGLRVNEACLLDLDDVRWELGRFGKLNVRHGKGSRRRGPKPRLVPLINGADRNLRWFIEDVWGQFDADHARPGAPLFPSERKCRDGSCLRATADVFRRSLAEAAGAPPAGLGGQADAARAAALLRLPALPGRDEPVRHPGTPRPFLDRHNGQVHPRSLPGRAGPGRCRRGELPVLRRPDPCGKPPRPGLLQQELQRACLVLPAQERRRTAATLAASSDRVGQLGAARGRRPRQAARRDLRLVTVHHPVHP
jgi:hypothetical protein